MKRSARSFLRRVGLGTTVESTPVESEAAPALPAGRYDKLSVEEVLAHLDELAPADLAGLGAHERANQNRIALLAPIDALLGNEPWPGYDDLDVDGVRFGLDGAGRDRFVRVLAYERAHKNRAGVVLAAQQKPGRGHA
jgi:hypothetical protein